MKRLALLAVVAAFAAGCTSFDKDWNAAAPSSPDGVSGRWTGTWQNTNNTHGGALKAVIKPTGTDEFAARFHAQWGRRSGSFRTPIRGHFEGGEFVFNGSKRIAGFKIATAGRIGPTNFNATYNSRFDNGTFTLTRPEQ